MPHIDTEKVAQMRKAIRKALPDYQISVRKYHHSTVDVKIMSGPIVKPEKGVNVFWYKENFKDRPDVIKVVDAIVAEIFKVQEPRELVYDGDYGSVPTFYYDVSFGAWDKPYVCTDPNAEAELAERLEIRREFNFIKQEQGYREWQESQQRQQCGIVTLTPDDLRIPCVLPVNHAGFCDAGR